VSVSTLEINHPQSCCIPFDVFKRHSGKRDDFITSESVIRFLPLEVTQMTLNKHIILIIIIIVVASAKNLLGYGSEEVILRIILYANAVVSNLGFCKITFFWDVIPRSIMASPCRSYRCETLKYSFLFVYKFKKSMAIHCLSILMKLKFIKQCFSAPLNAVRFEGKIIFMIHLIRFLYNMH